MPIINIHSFGLCIILSFNLYGSSKSESLLAKKVELLEVKVNDLSDQYIQDYPELDSKIDDLEHEIESLDYSLYPLDERLSNKCGMFYTQHFLNTQKISIFFFSKIAIFYANW